MCKRYATCCNCRECTRRELTHGNFCAACKGRGCAHLPEKPADCRNFGHDGELLAILPKKAPKQAPQPWDTKRAA